MKKSKSKSKTVKNHSGILLDIGCGFSKQQGFVGMDKREIPGIIDIVHDLEKIPYPLADESVLTCIASHILEHLDPALTIDIFDELWRIMKPGGQLIISTPYAGSFQFWQDPTHKNGFNEATFSYFDPSYPLFKVYRPRPWTIVRDKFTWSLTGHLEVIMNKITEEEANKILSGMSK